MAGFGICLLALTVFTAGQPGELWMHPLCTPLPLDRHGPFVLLDNGRLGTVDAEGFRTSEDDGRTWSEPVPVCPGINPREPASHYLLRTRKGTLILVYLNFTTYKFAWDAARGEASDDTKLEVWAIRSLDGGKTWQDNQRLLDGYNPNFFALIETSQGRVVVPLQHLTRDPGRLLCCSFSSEDEGLTWRRSNWIDLGGRGHHDGAFEPTVAELSDGRLLMLIRTSLDRFWEAISEDGGRYWRILRPSAIDASNSPGSLLRLADGKLVLVWNRLNPEGREYPKKNWPDGTEFPSSWHREELSIAFSEDDGRSWTKPVVIGRIPGGQLSYPYVFERRPGQLWILAGLAFRQGWQDPTSFRVKIDVDEFLRQTQ